MTLEFTILGCGSSGGVPRVGQGWGACDPANPRNRRRRCSLLVTRNGADGASTRVLVDTSPDLREQLLDAAVARLDAILLTHPHADHIPGMDAVRPLVIKQKTRIPIHMDEATAAVVRRVFSYIFVTPPGSLYPPILDLDALETGAPVTVEGPGGPVTATAFAMEHGPETALGFRFADAAYAPDVSTMPDAAKAQLNNLDLLIIDALRDTPHPTHFSVPDALALIEEVRPRRAILTNLHTDLDYGELSRRLPPGVVPAYDGLTVEVDG